MQITIVYNKIHIKCFFLKKTCWVFQIHFIIVAYVFYLIFAIIAHRVRWFCVVGYNRFCSIFVGLSLTTLQQWAWFHLNTKIQIGWAHCVKKSATELVSALQSSCTATQKQRAPPSVVSIFLFLQNQTCCHAASYRYLSRTALFISKQNYCRNAMPDADLHLLDG
jgi:hypothetical protein